MYTPTHLQWLDSQPSNGGVHPNGWPKFVTPEAQEWLRARVTEYVARMDKPQPLHRIVDHAFNRTATDRPECLNRIALIDAQYGLTYRALAHDHSQVWVKDTGGW